MPPKQLRGGAKTSYSRSFNAETRWRFFSGLRTLLQATRSLPEYYQRNVFEGVLGPDFGSLVFEVFSRSADAAIDQINRSDQNLIRDFFRETRARELPAGTVQGYGDQTQAEWDRAIENYNDHYPGSEPIDEVEVNPHGVTSDVEYLTPSASSTSGNLRGSHLEYQVTPEFNSHTATIDSLTPGGTIMSFAGTRVSGVTSATGSGTYTQPGNVPTVIRGRANKRTSLKQPGKLNSTAGCLVKNYRLSQSNYRTTIWDMLRSFDRTIKIHQEFSVKGTAKQNSVFFAPFVFRHNAYVSADIAEVTDPNSDLIKPGQYYTNTDFISGNTVKFLTPGGQAVAPALPLSGSAEAPTGNVANPWGYYSAYNICDFVQRAAEVTQFDALQLFTNYPYIRAPGVAEEYAANPGMGVKYYPGDFSTGTNPLLTPKYMGTNAGYLSENAQPHHMASTYVGSICSGRGSINPPGAVETALAESDQFVQNNVKFRFCDGHVQFNIVNANDYGMIVDMCVVRVKDNAAKCTGAFPCDTMAMPHNQWMVSQSVKGRAWKKSEQQKNEAPGDMKGTDWFNGWQQPLPNSSNVSNSILYSPYFTPFPEFAGIPNAGSQAVSISYPTGANPVIPPPVPANPEGTVNGGGRNQNGVGSAPRDITALPVESFGKEYDRYRVLLKESFQVPAGGRIRPRIDLGSAELNLSEFHNTQNIGSNFGTAMNMPALRWFNSAAGTPITINDVLASQVGY